MTFKLFCRVPILRTMAGAILALFIFYSLVGSVSAQTFGEIAGAQHRRASSTCNRANSRALATLRAGSRRSQPRTASAYDTASA